MKSFNVTGLCIPESCYMADVSEKVQEIQAMVEQGDYFTINRARQFGKTTMLYLLSRKLSQKYYVVDISFEGADDLFGSPEAFADGFIRLAGKALSYTALPVWIVEEFMRPVDSRFPMQELSDRIEKLCRDCDRELVLMIDEVDKSSDNQIFLSFLGLLRTKFLERKKGRGYTFHSVILAGVYDIKNIKQKIRPEEEQKYNSPWNVAVDFKVDMSLNRSEIASMLLDYEQDCHTGMELEKMADALYEYTSGYPFLVSRLCKSLAEGEGESWSVDSLREAVKGILLETNTLFDDLIKNIVNDKEFAAMVEEVVFAASPVPYRISNPRIAKGVMLGIFSERDGNVVISNRIFELYIYEYFISVNRPLQGRMPHAEYICEGRLDMEQVLRSFQKTMMKMEGNVDEFERFVESQGRLLMVAFLTPILNGSGHYVIESWAKERTRMDIQIFYGSQEEILELKIWHGEKRERESYDQLVSYLDSRGRKQGYLISFCFNRTKKAKVEWLHWKGHDIFEVIV